MLKILSSWTKITLNWDHQAPNNADFPIQEERDRPVAPAKIQGEEMDRPGHEEVTIQMKLKIQMKENKGIRLSHKTDQINCWTEIRMSNQGDVSDLYLYKEDESKFNVLWSTDHKATRTRFCVPGI